jgi:transposase InsO family protein
VNRYRFIAAEQAAGQSAVKACALLKISRSAYHEWTRDTPSKREESDAELEQRIAAIQKDSRGTYGAPRVHQELRRQGIACGRKRVARLMAKCGLVGRRKRRAQKTTEADPKATPVAKDLVQRAFDPRAREPNRAWVGDITYIRTWEGWLYLATVIDLASRRVVGFAMADHMRASLVCEALTMALRGRRPLPGVIFHSDRGSQYTSREFAALLAANRVTQSLSRPRQCWDNAVAESFFSTLKLELIHRQGWPTRAAAQRAVFEYIEVFYNRLRLHSALGYRSPAEYEATRAEPPRATRIA